jgi:hypothetical protein
MQKDRCPPDLNRPPATIKAPCKARTALTPHGLRAGQLKLSPGWFIETILGGTAILIIIKNSLLCLNIALI